MATYSQWSQTYFVNDTSRDDIVTANLTPDQHNMNNRWFQSMLDKLTDSGILYVPCLDKSFNRLGEEVNTNFDKSEDKVGVHKLQPLSYYDHTIKEELWHLAKTI